MSDNQRLGPSARQLAMIVGGTALAGTAAYLAYRQFGGHNPDGSPAEAQGAVPAAVASTPLSRSEELKKEGNSLFQQGKYTDALAKFDEAIAAAEGTEAETELIAVCHQNAAACLDKLNDYVQCVLRCTEALQKKPRYLKALSRRGDAHFKLNQYEEAMRDYSAVTMLDPENKLVEKFMPHLDVAHQKLLRASMDEVVLQRHAGLNHPIPQTAVVEWLEYSVVNDPLVNQIRLLREPTNDFEKILTLIKEKEFDNVAALAVVIVENEESEHRIEACLLAARFFMFHNNLAKVKEWVAKFKELFEALDEKSQEEYKQYLISIYQIEASISLSLEEAEQFVLKAAQLDPLNTDVRFGFAANAVMQRQNGRASNALDAVLGINPDHPFARFYRTHFDFSQACEEQHMANIHQHIVKMEQLLERSPKAPIFTYTVLANIHANSGNFPLAIKILDQGLAAYPDLSEFVMLKTLTQAKMAGTNENSVANMTQVFIDLCKRDPNNFEAQATYAKICAGKKDYEKAIECFERATLLARQPAELQLALSETILAQAAREAQVLLNSMEVTTD